MGGEFQEPSLRSPPSLHSHLFLVLGSCYVNVKPRKYLLFSQGLLNSLVGVGVEQSSGLPWSLCIGRKKLAKTLVHD